MSAPAQRLVRRLQLVGCVLATIWLAAACQSSEPEPTGGETHFLKRCHPDAGGCGGSLSCVCGVCTLPCSAQASCRAFAGAECVAASGDEVCVGADAIESHCDVRCSRDADCAALSAEHRCEAGACRAPGEDACPDGDVAANEVVVLGDSFFAVNHQVTAYLEDLARTAGVLSAGERYRDYSNLTANALAFPARGIAEQYASAKQEAPPKVVIMNGGGADVLLGSCDSLQPDCPLMVGAAEAATELLATMAADGVQHVVYAFYPDPVDSALREEVDVLRPLIQAACESSPLPCHWLDLRPTFDGRYDELVQADGMNPTAAGAEATARAIWAVMQRQCIAQ